MLFFLAEMGDKTQLATVAMAARYQNILAVTTGTTLGMLFSDGLAVFLGDKLAGKVQMKWLRWGAASLFFHLRRGVAVERDPRDVRSAPSQRHGQLAREPRACS